MFTGIVEETGQVTALERSGSGARLTVKASLVTQDLHVGDSIAVNGCCLTATKAEDGTLSFDLLDETLDRTNLKSVALGSLVNLERALAAYNGTVILVTHDRRFLEAFAPTRTIEL